MNMLKLGSRLLWSGIIAIVSAFAWIFAAVYVNRTFDFYTGALSQLGSPGAVDPWIYNDGLIFTSLLLFTFAVSLLIHASNRIESAGSSFLMVAALFLALIGVYHGGTYPHDFVSVWFFIQSDIAIITWGIGMLFSDCKWGISVITLSIVSTGIGFGVQWPSSAELETFGAAAISLWTVIMTIIMRHRDGMMMNYTSIR
ncbi:MAG: DUF998 domain-containing protein [Thermoplasmata archaeon]|uniref:DUF998 domain-containing protein n=1 Tax=Candidatus Sysuiplasma superficiale TaxID=2823368 RepID=A0A8J8CDQ6_9ARCH|nr:DUF998 domain-containing protein [Candidatus Sysuiplasma superficiale]MBX8644605.1 DUF998 domain-containing protein [Candidatus Sysuiplasma superficiale]